MATLPTLYIMGKLECQPLCQQYLPQYWHDQGQYCALAQELQKPFFAQMEQLAWVSVHMSEIRSESVRKTIFLLNLIRVICNNNQTLSDMY